MFRRLIVLLMFTGFRLAEIVAHTSGEIMYLTFESLTWLIGGVVVIEPTLAMLMALRPGLDGALLAPPRAKPDQWGEIHCPFPAMLVYRADGLNAARALRDLELRAPCRGAAARRVTPLFSDESGRPFTHAFLDRLLKAVLLCCFGKAAAMVFTWHSFRVGLATALHAAGVSDAMIQLICRWMCPESLHAYRRVGTSEHDGYLQKAAQADVSAIQSANVVRVAADQGFAAIMSVSEGPRGHLEEAAFEAAKSAALREPAKPIALVQPTLRAAAPVVAPVVLVGAGLQVLVPAAVYPNEVCDEHEGRGWTAVVLSTSKLTLQLKFAHARDASGEAFGPVRLPRRCVEAHP